MNIDAFQSEASALLKSAETDLKSHLREKIDLKALVGDANISLSRQPDKFGTQFVLNAYFGSNHDLLCDNVALIVSLRDIPSPSVNAEVTWGHPWCHEDAAYSEDNVEMTPENLQRVYDDLPRLIRIFYTAVRRGTNLLYQWYQSVAHDLQDRDVSLAYFDEEGSRSCSIRFQHAGFVGTVTYWPTNDFEFQFNDTRSGEVIFLESKSFDNLGALIIHADKLMQKILHR